MKCMHLLPETMYLSRFNNAKSAEDTLIFFGCTPLFLLQKNCQKMVNFCILPLKELLVVTFREALSFTSRKYVSKLDIIIPYLSDKLNIFWSHFSVFALEK